MREMCTYIKEPLIIARRERKNLKPLKTSSTASGGSGSAHVGDNSSSKPLKPRSHPLGQTNPPLCHPVNSNHLQAKKQPTQSTPLFATVSDMSSRSNSSNPEPAVVERAPPTAISAPGKVLLAGGYLVLDPKYSGVVVSTSARFYTFIKERIDGHAASQKIVVRSPQFLSAAWSYQAVFTKNGTVGLVPSVEKSVVWRFNPLYGVFVNQEFR